MKPIVAIVGRPNVGKSTFFNRLTKSRAALVDDMPGVTRDRHYGDVNWEQQTFTLVDTGGFVSFKEDEFAEAIRFQIKQAIADADAIILLLDGRQALSPFDRELVDILRLTDKPVFYGVNKVDGPELEENLYDFYALGIETPYPVSGAHGYGIHTLLEDLVAVLPRADVEPPESEVRLAVVGRPNVGKSSLINRILGEDRLVVSNVPGTTRDAVDTVVKREGKTYRFVDTAGIRRKSKVSQKLEKFSVIKALKSLESCDVALILIDAADGLTDQDITIAGYAHERGCGCVFLFNKWDALAEKDDKTARRFKEDLRYAAKFLAFAPAMTISALTGLRVPRIFDLVDTVYSQYTTRIGTGQLNRIFEAALYQNEPSMYQGKRLKFYYATQVSVRPPTFVAFVNVPQGIHFSYQRYLINQIREAAGLDKTPIKLYFRERSRRKDFSGQSRRKRKKKN